MSLEPQIPRLVLVTRPETEFVTTSQRLRAMGFEAVAAPLLTIRSITPQLPSRFQAILVTSGNALSGLEPSAIPLLAVGDATAARARAMGFTQVHSAGRDAAALAGLAAARLDPSAGTLVLATGRGQGARLAADLRAAGFTVLRRLFYEARPAVSFPPKAADALRSGRLHAALFLSADTARAFIRKLPRELHGTIAPVLAVAIGKAAADALKPLPWRQIRLAANPTLDDVLAQL